MAQQTDLPPLSPSRGDLLRAWWRPWSVVLWLVGKLIPLAIPVALMWLFYDEFFGVSQEVAQSGALEAAAQEAAAGMGGMMFDVMTLVWLAMMAVMIGKALTHGPRV